MAISWVAKQALSKSILLRFDQSPSFLGWSIFRCAVGLSGIALALPLIYNYLKVREDSETYEDARLGFKILFITNIVGSPVALYFISRIAQALFKKLVNNPLQR